MPIYMKYEGVNGSAKGKHNGWIELESCQVGINRHITNPSGRGSSREANVPSVPEIVITKVQDNASTPLFKESLTGAGKKVTIDFVGKDGEVYMSIELENVLISSFSVSGSGGDAQNKPLESLSLNATKISYSTKATATMNEPKDRSAWDLATK